MRMVELMFYAKQTRTLQFGKDVNVGDDAKFVDNAKFVEDAKFGENVNSGEEWIYLTNSIPEYDFLNAWKGGGGAFIVVFDLQVSQLKAFCQVTGKAYWRCLLAFRVKQD